jgi:hypothetical protein
MAPSAGATPSTHRPEVSSGSAAKLAKDLCPNSDGTELRPPFARQPTVASSMTGLQIARTMTVIAKHARYASLGACHKEGY